jgi:hypothetical protein
MAGILQAKKAGYPLDNGSFQSHDKFLRRVASAIRGEWEVANSGAWLIKT